MGDILLAFGLIGGLLLALWIQEIVTKSNDNFIESQKTKEEENRLKIIDKKNRLEALEFKKNKLIGAEMRLEKTLEQLGKNTNHCIKCEGNKSRIWNLNQKTIELSCVYCKNKTKYYDKDFKNFDFNTLIIALEDYYLLEEKKWENEYINFYSISNYDYDYKSIKNPPKHSNFLINNLIENIKVDTVANSSRRISQSVKDKVWNRDSGKCVECGSNENLEFDHIIPHSKGGANTYRNIQLLCEKCNRAKSDKIG